VSLLGGIWVDVFFPFHKAVVEVMGPLHYLSNGERNGRTLFKHQLLEGAGFKVRSVKIRRFGHLKKDEQTVFVSALVQEIKSSIR
jgi:hypothetical protein